MPDSTALGLFMVATLMLNLTPGPDMLYVIGNSVGQGRKAGIVSALGVGAGCLFHTAAAAFGLSALLTSFPLAYEAIRYAGAAYLLYLGARTFASKANALSPSGVQQESLLATFRRGVTTNVLNPKVALFFLAFLPQFVDPSKGAAVWQFLLLGTLFNVSGTTVNILVAVISGTLGDWLAQRPGVSRVQRWFTGTVFVTLGARIALAGGR